MSIMNGVTVHAPVTNPKQIVDVGCGTGVITCYLGERFPDAQVWGIDISPVPAMREKPTNVTFVQGDFHTLASTDGRFAPGSADLVFNRLLICGMTDWKRYIETAARMLRLGGYLEVQEVEWRWYREGEVIGEDWDWRKAYYAALEAKGLDEYCVGRMEGLMRDADVEGVQVKCFPWPFTKEQKEMYRRLLPNVLAGQGHSEEEIGVVVEEASRVMDWKGMYKKFCVTVGRKGS